MNAFVDIVTTQLYKVPHKYGGGFNAEINKAVRQEHCVPGMRTAHISRRAAAWDGLRLTPGSKTYIVEVRVNCVSRRLTLGRDGVLTRAAAAKFMRIRSAKEGQASLIVHGSR